MKLLLIKLREQSAPGMLKTYTPPIGLWSIREAARRRGHECTVVDLNIQERVPIEEHFDVEKQLVQIGDLYHEVLKMSDRTPSYQVPFIPRIIQFISWVSFN